MVGCFTVNYLEIINLSGLTFHFELGSTNYGGFPAPEMCFLSILMVIEMV